MLHYQLRARCLQGRGHLRTAFGKALPFSRPPILSHRQGNKPLSMQ